MAGVRTVTPRETHRPINQNWYSAPTVKDRDIVKMLQAHGWSVLRTQGSHVRMGKGSARTTVPVHGARDVKAGTLASIERQTGLVLK